MEFRKLQSRSLKKKSI